jgi:hypothetical protein
MPRSASATGHTPPQPTPEELQRIAAVLTPEYGLLMASLGAEWSASLVRTSIFLAVLGASAAALGFAAQTGVDSSQFRTLALIVLPIVLFLGVATFIRLVQVQRESIVIITGLNRIRHFFQSSVPAAKPYYVLPAHDDEHGLYRSPGTGMPRRIPRIRLVYLVVLTLPIAFVGFIVTVGALFAYWQRSIAELSRAIRPINPTPPDEIDAPI